MQWFEGRRPSQCGGQLPGHNNGIIPIVVANDATGDVAANPVCTDSPKDKVMTYLTQ